MGWLRTDGDTTCVTPGTSQGPHETLAPRQSPGGGRGRLASALRMQDPGRDALRPLPSVSQPLRECW